MAYLKLDHIDKVFTRGNSLTKQLGLWPGIQRGFIILVLRKRRHVSETHV